MGKNIQISTSAKKSVNHTRWGAATAMGRKSPYFGSASPTAQHVSTPLRVRLRDPFLGCRNQLLVMRQCRNQLLHRLLGTMTTPVTLQGSGIQHSGITLQTVALQGSGTAKDQVMRQCRNQLLHRFHGTMKTPVAIQDSG